MNASTRLIWKMSLTSWLAALLAASALHAAESNTVTAIWKPVDLQFSYQGMTTHYSCDALEWKVEQIVKLLGAHENTRVSATGCPTNGPSRNAFVRIKGGIPVPATPEAKEAVTKDQSRQDLLKRLGIQPNVDQDEFPAVWKTVDLSRERKPGLEAGDCELIEQLGRELLPKLGMKVVQTDANCYPGQVPISVPRFVVKALVKAGADNESKQTAGDKAR
jgi:hypothetical protein